MGSLFGSSPKGAKAFRAPGFKDQFQVLNDLGLGNVFAANPQLQGQQQAKLEALLGQKSALQQQIKDTPQQFAGIRNMRAGGRQGVNPLAGQLQSQLSGLNSEIAQLQGQQAQFGGQTLQGQQGGQDFRSFQPGQFIAGQPQPNIQLEQLQGPQFQQRDPFQFQQSFDPASTSNTFNQFADQLEQRFARQGEKQDLGIREDLNRRGLLTAGATTQAQQQAAEGRQAQFGRELTNFGIQQARQQDQANQFAAQQDANRQAQQAAELFRQQGATDAQAIQMAQNALQRRGQNLQGQQALFQQGLQGRQAGLQEFGVGQALQQAPQDFLLKLASLSAGKTPAQPGSTGLLPGLIGAGAKIGSAFI